MEITKLRIINILSSLPLRIVKDKAAVLLEVTKLQEIREELAAEVTSLHAQLEQERSKNHASNAETKTTKQNVNLSLFSIYKKYNFFNL